METKVNLRGMIQLDQIEDLLSNLIDTVNAQQKEIESLKLLCGGFVINQTVDQKFWEVQSRMVNLETQLDEVNRRATSRLEGTEIPAGELAAYNSNKIQDITETLSDLATLSELHDVAGTIIEQHQTDIKSIYEWAAPIDVTRTLQSSHQNISARVTGIEAMVSCKLDRSEIGHLEALAARLQLYEDFKEDEVRTLASKTETRALARELEIQNAAMQLCAKATDIKLIKRQIEDIDRRVIEGKTKATSLEQMSSATRAELQGKASTQDVHACVRRRHYDEAVCALGAAIDDKAPITGLSHCEGRVQILEEQSMSHNGRLELVTRFVEWFTSRGENYEHNMKIIDKHLGNLALPGGNSLPERSPYDGQIRFTSVMAQQRES